MSEIKYFSTTKTDPPSVIRSGPDGDEVFVKGRWKPTGSVLAYRYGLDDHVDEITEPEARRLAPDAFA